MKKKKKKKKLINDTIVKWAMGYHKALPRLSV